MHKEYPFKSHFFQVAKHRIHYVDEGEGRCVVLVHGNPTWSFYYRKVISQLSKSMRVIAIDNIGCGLSDKPQNYEYSLHNHIENLCNLLKHLNVQKCSLVLHDWGGAIGMGYAVEHSEHIEKIVLLNTAAFRSAKIPFRISICKLPVLGEFVVRGLNGFAYPATFMALEKKMEKDIKAMYLMPYNSWKNRVAIHNFVKDIPLKRSHNSYALLEKIEKGLKKINENNIPVLILWGGKDFCFTKHFYNRWREILPEAECVYYDDFGHYVLEEDYSSIAPKLENFFKNERKF